MLTPALSILVLTLVVLALAGTQNYLLPLIVVTASKTSVMPFLIIGIALYMYEYRRREATDGEAKVILLLSFVLIQWGVLTYLFASGLYNNPWARAPNNIIRALTIWDYLQSGRGSC